MVLDWLTFLKLKSNERQKLILQGICEMHSHCRHSNTNISQFLSGHFLFFFFFYTVTCCRMLQLT